MAKRALITGASGFIASHLAAKMSAKGWEIGLLVRPSSQLISQLESMRSYSYDGTLTSIDQCLQDFKPDVVFHLASLFLSEHQASDLSRLIESNILLGTQLLESMAGHDVNKLVNTGTSWQHFNSDQYCPVNLYAATKQAFEAILQYYIDAKGISCITLKLFDSYGPGDHRKKLVNILIDNIHTGTHLELSPGEQLIDLVYIDDVVHGFEIAADLLLNKSLLGHHSYGLSSGMRVSIQELVRIISRIGNKNINVSWTRPYRNREVMRPWEPPITLPGWNPIFSLERGLKKLLDSRS